MTIEHRLTAAERQQRDKPTRVNSTPEFEQALFDLFFRIQKTCCAACTTELKAERSEHTGEVADLCFSDCLVFRTAEDAESEKLSAVDPLERELYNVIHAKTDGKRR